MPVARHAFRLLVLVTCVVLAAAAAAGVAWLAWKDLGVTAHLLAAIAVGWWAGMIQRRGDGTNHREQEARVRSILRSAACAWWPTHPCPRSAFPAACRP